MRGAVSALAVVVAFLAGCTIMVKTDVARFDELPKNTTGKAVYFLPLENQAASAAYQTYVKRVAAELAKHGMRRTNDSTEANYAAIIAYGSSSGRQVSGAIPIHGQTGGGTTYHSGSISTFGSGGLATGFYTGQSSALPTYGIVGMMPYTRTEYDRFFTIRMIDLDQSTLENPVPVYEGNATSTGSNATFDQVAGCMIGALFQDFRTPGADRVISAKLSCDDESPLPAAVDSTVQAGDTTSDLQAKVTRGVDPPSTRRSQTSSTPTPVQPTAVPMPLAPAAPPETVRTSAAYPENMPITSKPNANPPAYPAEVPAVVPSGDPCAKYANTPTWSRCKLYAGPDGWKFIPEAGDNADLDTQLRCAPYRTSPEHYVRCISS